MAAVAGGLADKGQVQAHYDRLDREQQQLASGSASPYAPSPLPLPPASPSGSSAPIPVDSEVGDGDGGHAELPPYSGPSSSSSPAPRAAGRAGPQRYPGLPWLDYRLYSPPLFELSGDCTAVRSTAPYLSATAAALAALARAQSTIPPKLQLHITGTRGRKVDFAIRLNLMALLVPEDARRRMDYIRCVGEDELVLRGGSKPDLRPHVGDGGVDEWCRRFVEDPAAVKVFVLERQVVNADLAWLEGQVRSLVATTDYRGVVAVSFPVTHARVVVQSPDRVNRFFTSVTTLFSGKSTYEVVKAVWPFATHRPGEPGRRFAVQSEDTWWREWRDPIKYAIATKRKGWVTNEDKLEALMEGKGKGAPIVDWGPEL